MLKKSLPPGMRPLTCHQCINGKVLSDSQPTPIGPLRCFCLLPSHQLPNDTSCEFFFIASAVEETKGAATPQTIDSSPARISEEFISQKWKDGCSVIFSQFFLFIIVK